MGSPQAIASRITVGIPSYRVGNTKAVAARRRVITIYDHNPAHLQQLREALVNKVLQVLNAESFDQLNNEDAKLWPEFMEGIAADGNPEDIKTPTVRALRDSFCDRPRS